MSELQLMIFGALLATLVYRLLTLNTCGRGVAMKGRRTRCTKLRQPEFRPFQFFDHTAQPEFCIWHIRQGGSV
jgi:hypothetical protein